MLLAREERLVVEDLDRLREALPFPRLGVDSDKGNESLNDALNSHCSQQRIALTRSRP